MLRFTEMVVRMSCRPVWVVLATAVSHIFAVVPTLTRVPLPNYRLPIIVKQVIYKVCCKTVLNHMHLPSVFTNAVAPLTAGLYLQIHVSRSVAPYTM